MGPIGSTVEDGFGPFLPSRRPGDDPAMKAQSNTRPVAARRSRSDRFLETLEPFDRVVLSSHINPDPDALASMLGLRAVIEHRRPEVDVTLTLDGMLARAENRAMVELLEIPLVP